MRLASLAENLTLKIFSLAVAVLLFLFVSVESATPIDVDFRVEYRTADDIVVVGEAPSVVHTTLRGPWATFRSYDLGDLKPVVKDITHAGPGTIRLPIDTADIEPPGGMSVVAVRPAEVTLTLDRYVERHVPVRVDIVGQPPPGYVYEGAQVSPQRVRVSGPAAEMQKAETLPTRPIDIQDRQDDFEVEVDLTPPAPPLRLKDRRVTVNVRIAEELVTRSFDDVEVLAQGGPAGIRLSPERVSIKLQGPRSLIESLDPEVLEPYVDVQPELESGLVTFEKAVNLRGHPERTQWVGAAPHVQVQIPRSRPKRSTRK